MFPAFKPLPKVFLKPVGYLSFASAADLDHDVPWGLGREAPLVREPEGCAPRCRVVRVAEDIGGKLSFHDCTYSSPAGGAHRILSDAWHKLWPPGHRWPSLANGLTQKTAAPRFTVVSTVLGFLAAKARKSA